MSLSPRETAEKAARYRFIIMNVARISGLALVMFGIAMTRFSEHLSLQWIVGAALAVLGLLEFFFLPAIIAKRWKAADRKLK
jgi:uncharacterized membrane protein YhaH (DUF805 family)